jgi:hypothetical protein
LRHSLRRLRVQFIHLLAQRLAQLGLYIGVSRAERQ